MDSGEVCGIALVIGTAALLILLLLQLRPRWGILKRSRFLELPELMYYAIVLISVIVVAVAWILPWLIWHFA